MLLILLMLMLEHIWSLGPKYDQWINDQETCMISDQINAWSQPDQKQSALRMRMISILMRMTRSMRMMRLTRMRMTRMLTMAQIQWIASPGRRRLRWRLMERWIFPQSALFDQYPVASSTFIFVVFYFFFCNSVFSNFLLISPLHPRHLWLLAWSPLTALSTAMRRYPIGDLHRIYIGST